MQEIESKEYYPLVEAICVVDLQSNLELFRPDQQKWISSLDVLSEIPKELKTHCKYLTIAHNFCVQINFCQRNRKPIYEIQFITNPSLEWIPVRMPNALHQQYNSSSLCYKTQEIQFLGPLTDIQILKTQHKSRYGIEKQVFTVPAGYKIISNPINNSYLIYKRVRSCLEQYYKPILLEQYPLLYKIVNLNMLPIFCFPQGVKLYKQLKGFILFNFILTTQTAKRIYVNCLIFKQDLRIEYKHKLGIKPIQKIYSQKAICILSQYRYTDQFCQCLQHLYRLSMSKNDLPFHSVIKNFYNELKLTKNNSISGINYSYGGSNISFDNYKNYPCISEYAIYCIFKFLQISIIINIFQAILLEKKIFFVSQSKTILGYAVEAFLSLIYPFKWQHVLIPILPSTLKEYLNAPVPLIAGISPSMLNTTLDTDNIIIQLDSCQILNDQDLPPLPEKMYKQLYRKLQSYQLYNVEDVNQYLQNPQNTYLFKMQPIDNPSFNSFQIRDIFYQFILTLMRNYRKYWVQYIQYCREIMKFLK